MLGGACLPKRQSLRTQLHMVVQTPVLKKKRLGGSENPMGSPNYAKTQVPGLKDKRDPQVTKEDNFWRVGVCLIKDLIRRGRTLFSAV